MKFSTHWISLFFCSKQVKATSIHIWWVTEQRSKKKQFDEKCKLANLLKIPQRSLLIHSLLFTSNVTTIQVGGKELSHLLKIKKLQQLQHCLGAVILTFDLPSQNTSEEGGVEALWWWQAPLHLCDGHFVLGSGAEQRQATRNRAEQVGGVDNTGATYKKKKKKSEGNLLYCVLTNSTMKNNSAVLLWLVLFGFGFS